MTVVRGVGIPLQLDQATTEKKYGYYVCILKEMNLSCSLPDIISVELPDYAFDVEIHYENLPARCTGCSLFGHTIDKCRCTLTNGKGQVTKRVRPSAKES